MVHNHISKWREETYMSLAFCQKRRPHNVELRNMKTMWVRLWEGFLQYEQCCFQRQAFSCPQPVCEKREGKLKASDPTDAELSCSTISLFSLQEKTEQNNSQNNSFYRRMQKPLWGLLHKDSLVQSWILVCLCKIHSKLFLCIFTSNI